MKQLQREKMCCRFLLMDIITQMQRCTLCLIGHDRSTISFVCRGLATSFVKVHLKGKLEVSISKNLFFSSQFNTINRYSWIATYIDCNWDKENLCFGFSFRTGVWNKAGNEKNVKKSHLSDRTGSVSITTAN